MDFNEDLQKTTSLNDYAQFKALLIQYEQVETETNPLDQRKIQSVTNIPLIPCYGGDKDSDTYYNLWNGFYPIKASQKSQFEAHDDQNQFWCVHEELFVEDNPDLNIGLLNRIDSKKYMSVEFFLETCYKEKNPGCQTDAEKSKFLQGKKIMIRANTQYIDYSKEELSASNALVAESELLWFSFLEDHPMTNRITY